MKIVTQTLAQMAGQTPLSLPQRKVVSLLLTTILLVRGKVNFLNLSRYCPLSERTLRRHFRREFDWPRFNALLVAHSVPPTATQVVALDASFVKKSGKRTYGIGWFWNGCAGRAEKGLEVSLVSLIDVDANTAYALSVRQTQPVTAKDTKDTKEKTLMVGYLEHLRAVSACVPSSVRYGVFDGAFAREKFVSGVVEMGLHVVSKLRCDANLRYLYNAKTGPEKKRGRPKLYDGKVRFDDLSRWQDLGKVEKHLHLYTVIAQHKSLGRVIRVVLLLCDKNPTSPKPTQPRYVLLFSTDVGLDAKEIYRFYKARFQMEFLFRDSKQWTGLNDSQARDERALHFHFNAALSAVNVSKVERTVQMKVQPPQGETQPASMKQPSASGKRVFSLGSAKQRGYNEHLLESFIDNFDLEPSWIKCHPSYHHLCNYGVITP